MSENKKSYFAIIPANIRYDKSLPMSARMLYGELTALSNEKGFCYASNNYFAELYDVTPQAVSKWINLLADKKYIKLEYIKNGKEVKERHIYIQEVSTNIDTVSTPVSEVSTYDEEGINIGLKGYQQKIKENNTDINNTINNTVNNTVNNTSDAEVSAKAEVKKSSSSKTEEKTETGKKVKAVINAYIQNFKDLYNQGKVNLETPIIDYKVSTVLIKKLLNTISVEQIIQILNNAMNDSWIVGEGYCLNFMLSATQANKLLSRKPVTKSGQSPYRQVYTDEEYRSWSDDPDTTPF